MPKLTSRLLAASVLLSLLAVAGSRLQPSCAPDDVASTIRARLACDGGCTVDPRSGKLVGPVDAYAVSLEGYEREFATVPSLAAIRAYLQEHTAIFADRPCLFVGAWQDGHTGRCYLDLTELIPDRTAAVARGRANDQRCIYHMTTSREIRLRREDRITSRISTAGPTRR